MCVGRSSDLEARLAWVSTSACEPGVRSQKLPAYSNREVEIRRGRIGNETLQDITTVHSCPICSLRFWRPPAYFPGVACILFWTGLRGIWLGQSDVLLIVKVLHHQFRGWMTSALKGSTRAVFPQGRRQTPSVFGLRSGELHLVDIPVF
jgi:hypothetical protein